MMNHLEGSNISEMTCLIFLLLVVFDGLTLIQTYILSFIFLIKEAFFGGILLDF